MATLTTTHRVEMPTAAVLRSELRTVIDQIGNLREIAHNVSQDHAGQFVREHSDSLDDIANILLVAAENLGHTSDSVPAEVQKRAEAY